jgi:hypothetical protein
VELDADQRNGIRPAGSIGRRFSRVPVGTALARAWILAVVLLSGCASLHRPPPPSLEQVVEMGRAGTPPEEIVRRLEESRAVYPLSGSQIARLHEQGVPDAVLDYMQDAYVGHLRRQERAWQGGGVSAWNCYYCYYPPTIVVPY